MTPCFNCQTRSVGCHSDCEAYKRYRAVLDAESKRRATDYAVRCVLAYGIRKSKKQAHLPVI